MSGTFLKRSTRAALATLAPETFQDCLDDLAERGIGAMCAERAWSIRAFLTWVYADPKREGAYWDALRIAADIRAQECIGIADDVEGDHRRDRLRIMTRLELASKWDRGRYGNRTTVEHAGDSGALALDAALAGMMVGMIARSRDGYQPQQPIDGETVPEFERRPAESPEPDPDYVI